MKNVNVPTLVCTLIILGVTGFLYLKGQTAPATISALVGVVVNSFLPQLFSKAKVTVTATIGSDPPKAAP